MRYAVISVVNGSFKVETEHGENKQAAFVKFHDLCKIYWNAPDVITCMVKVVDENLDTVEGKMEYITHTVAEQTQQTPAEPAENTEE
jgi:hypothetical protein